MANLVPGPGLMSTEPSHNPVNRVNPANPVNPVPELVRTQRELFANNPLMPGEQAYIVLLEGDAQGHPYPLLLRPDPGIWPIGTTQFWL